jgi:tetratricopeptide (TPR) repeat protein
VDADIWAKHHERPGDGRDRPIGGMGACHRDAERAARANVRGRDRCSELGTVYKIGDAVRAVELARRACELADNRQAGYLDTLAAAYAAAGRFREAVATIERAIEVAGATGPPPVPINRGAK